MPDLFTNAREIISDRPWNLVWVLNPNVQIEAGWVYLIKGSYIERLRGLGIAGVPNDDNVSYTFIQTILKF